MDSNPSDRKIWKDIPYGEAWLLHQAVHGYIPLTFLAMSDEAISQQFNTPSHNMPRQELLYVLWSLFERGDLLAYQEMAGEHIPTLGQLDAALVEPQRHANGATIWGTGVDGPLRYALTASGAAKWEEFAQPDWSRFYWMQGTETEAWEIVAGSETRREELLRHSPLLWRWEILAESVERTTLIPWEATYWKTLPVGWQVRFRPDPDADPLLPLKYNDPASLEMYTRIRQWCVEPWDDQDQAS